MKGDYIAECNQPIQVDCWRCRKNHRLIIIIIILGFVNGSLNTV
jgi:hypothetical protein